MIKFEKKRTEHTPYILVNSEKKIVEISGVLRATLDYPELYEKMYNTIFKLIEANENKNSELVFNFMILRCNKSTRRGVFRILQKINLSKINSKINWYYEKDDEDILEYIEDIIEILPTLNVNIIEVDNILDVINAKNK